MKLSISTNFPDVQRRLQGLRADIQSTVAARAVNSVAAQGKTQMSREITKDYRVLARDVKARLKLKKAVAAGAITGVEAQLVAEGRRSVNVIRFGAKQTDKGVSISVLKGRRKTIDGAFIANKGRTVFVRARGTTMRSRQKYSGTKHADQLAPVATIFVPSMFNQRRINAAVIKAIEDRFRAAFEREVRFAEGRFKR